mmetsp:Transcript_48271/g.137876  ORF Transcript_48271/g.137876 Transcript_48271/m.137876 type:complete len:210 (+) Transcript_48271:544-1173(+)
MASQSSARASASWSGNPVGSPTPAAIQRASWASHARSWTPVCCLQAARWSCMPSAATQAAERASSSYTRAARTSPGAPMALRWATSTLRRWPSGRALSRNRSSARAWATSGRAWSSPCPCASSSSGPAPRPRMYSGRSRSTTRASASSPWPRSTPPTCSSAAPFCGRTRSMTPTGSSFSALPTRPRARFGSSRGSTTLARAPAGPACRT